MKNIFCFGIITEEIKGQLASGGFKVFSFIESNDFKKEAKDSKSKFLLIEDERFNEISSSLNKNTPFIIFTRQKISLDGLDFFRYGALDYLSSSNENFVSLLIERIEKTIAINKKDFLDKIVQDTENLYYSIIEDSPQIILVCNNDGQIIISNKVANQKMKISDDNELVSHYLDPVLGNDFINLLKSVHNTQNNCNFQCSIIKGTDDLTPILWHMTYFAHVLEGTIVVFGEDISEFEEMRKKEFYKTKSLLVLNERLERSNKSLDQFSRMISHDLKNGLGRILGFARILNQNENSNLSDSGKDIALKITQNTDDMVLTVNRILDFARSKGADIQVRKFKINDILTKVITDFHHQIQEVNGRVEMQFEDIEIEADLICMKQIFENLITNAIKYRSPERTLLLKVSILDMGADILIIFEDNGIGIKPGDEEKLFEEYYRNQEIATKVAGHGIGLSTVKTLLDSHGGVIWVDPDALVGSSFNIQLPKVQ